MPNHAYDREHCCGLLRRKADALKESGLTRYPQRSDFSEAEVVAIKAHLGPWPRALEAAGLKPPREDKSAAERNRAKRARQKEPRREPSAPDNPEDSSSQKGETI